jgi:hypothetical protein
LWLDPIFRFTDNNRWSDQQLRVVVRLPINMRVYIQSDLEPLIGELSRTGHNWVGHYMNHPLTMANDGLVKTE